MKKVVATVPKNLREEIIISLVQCGGSELVEVRVFAEVEGMPARVPTRKGILVRPAILQALIDALAKARDATKGAA